MKIIAKEAEKSKLKNNIRLDKTLKSIIKEQING